MHQRSQLLLFYYVSNDMQRQTFFINCDTARIFSIIKPEVICYPFFIIKHQVKIHFTRHVLNVTSQQITLSENRCWRWTYLHQFIFPNKNWRSISINCICYGLNALLDLTRQDQEIFGLDASGPKPLVPTRQK